MPMRVCIFLLLAGFSCLSANPARGDEPLRLTRDRAVAMAVHRNLDLRVQALNSSLAEERIRRSGAFYDPYLAVSSRYGETAYPGETFGTTSTNTSVDLSQELPTGGSLALQVQTGYTSAEPLSGDVERKDWLSSVGVSISQPLLKDAGREVNDLGITLSRNSHAQSLENFRFFLADTLFAVITSYNRLYVLRQVYEARQSALDQARALRAKLVGEKGGRRVDLTNADYAISQRQKDLIDDAKQLRDQEAKLRYLIGLQDNRRILPVDAPSREEPPESEADALRLALENRNDLKQLRLELEASELEERVSKHQLLPSLDFDASGGFSGDANVIGRSFDEISNGRGGWWSAGLSFRLPLGNTAAASDHRQDNIRTRQLRDRIRAYEWKVRDGIQSDMRALISARLQMRSADTSLRYAEQRLRQYGDQLQQGKARVKDVLDAQDDLVRARNAQVEAVDSFAYAVARLWRNMGVLLQHQHMLIKTDDPDQLTNTAEAGSAKDMELLARGREVARASEAAAAVVPENAQIQAHAKAVPVAGSEGDAVEAPGQVGHAEQTAATAPARLLVRDYFSRGSAARTQKKLAAEGLRAELVKGPKKKHTMTRLLIGTYSSFSEARAALKRLGKARDEGFILGSRAKGYRAFAGSHLSMRQALSEQRRLAAQGVETSPVSAEVAMPTWRLLVPVPDQGSDLERLQRRLDKLGFKALPLSPAPGG